jgi:DNA-binding response OmpR family regulator
MHRVFIIDDEMMVITMLSEYLVKSNFICQSAQDGVNIILKIQGFKPDIIICDLNMQPGDGIDILKEVKQYSDLKMIPFIFISASENEQTIINALAEGASGYISKSLDLEDFKAKLMHIIEKKLPAKSD